MITPAKRIALYIRSSEHNNERLIDTQLESLRSACLSANKEIVRIYIDRGFSGLSKNRPSLQQMLLDAKDRAFDEVMVTSFSKLTRKIRVLVQILDELHSDAVVVSTPNQTLDLSKLPHRLALQMMTAVANYETSGAERC